jgi:hypothetical protein
MSMTIPLTYCGPFFFKGGNVFAALIQDQSEEEEEEEKHPPKPAKPEKNRINKVTVVTLPVTPTLCSAFWPWCGIFLLFKSALP